MNKLFILLIVLILSANIATGQQKDKSGYLFGNVVYAAEQQGNYATAASGIIVEIKHKNKVIKIITNEAGLIDEKLQNGKYLLLSARTAAGILLDFKPDQYKYFQIKSRKTERFDIVLLKPKLKLQSLLVNFGRF